MAGLRHATICESKNTRTQKTMSKQVETTVLETMAQAESRLGLPSGALKRWKRCGAAGFVGSRVYPKPLFVWLLKNASIPRKGDKDETEAGLKRRKLRLQCEGIAWTNARERGKYVLRVEVTKFLQAVAFRSKDIIRRRLTSELPDLVAGLQPAEAQIELEKVAREITETLRKAAKDV
jgi:hypothetical protein